MSVTMNPSGIIELAGTCSVEDAETLLQHLMSAESAVVDWSECEAAHTAVIQVLLVAGTRPTGVPRGRFLREYVGPLLARGMWVQRESAR